MDIDLSAADLAFRDDVRNFLKTNAYKPGADYTVWRDQWFAKAAAKGGWDVPKWPKTFGGPGWTPTQHYIWEQETATRRCHSTCRSASACSRRSSWVMARKEQQERFLPDIRARKVNWCQGYSEPGAGSDLASLKTQGRTLGRRQALRRERHEDLDDRRAHRRLDLLPHAHLRHRHASRKASRSCCSR